MLEEAAALLPRVILGLLVDVLGVVRVGRQLRQRANQVLAGVGDLPPREPVRRRRERVLRALDAREPRRLRAGDQLHAEPVGELLLVDVGDRLGQPDLSRELSICGS
jgi:hypothetical protein